MSKAKHNSTPSMNIPTIIYQRADAFFTSFLHMPSQLAKEGVGLSVKPMQLHDLVNFIMHADGNFTKGGSLIGLVFIVFSPNRDILYIGFRTTDRILSQEIGFKVIGYAVKYAQNNDFHSGLIYHGCVDLVAAFSSTFVNVKCHL